MQGDYVIAHEAPEQKTTGIETGMGWTPFEECIVPSHSEMLLEPSSEK